MTAAIVSWWRNRK
ncbi:hypothetical protein LAW60_20125 [Escherichia coli]|nr:hypothetical protein [Escherichia coli]MDD8249461.1 hypothetical protein [Escherichia coli]MDD8359121.1 hypothetical protein [Escherichia coli]